MLWKTERRRNTPENREEDRSGKQRGGTLRENRPEEEHSRKQRGGTLRKTERRRNTPENREEERSEERGNDDEDNSTCLFHTILFH